MGVTQKRGFFLFLICKAKSFANISHLSEAKIYRARLRSKMRISFAVGKYRLKKINYRIKR